MADEDPRPSQFQGSWEFASSNRDSLPSQADGGSVALAVERQGSSFATNRSSVPGGRARRKVDTKSSVLGKLGLGSSFFRGNVKEEMKKQVRAEGRGAGVRGAGVRGSAAGWRWR